MTFRVHSLATLASLASLAVACGGSHTGGSGNPVQAGTGGASGTGGSSGGGADGGGALACDPNAAIPCHLGMTEPCDGVVNSGYEGDEYCMKPPDQGWQIHVGPSDYTNPDELAKWELPPGAGDVNWCYEMKAPNDQVEYTSAYYSHMRPGSHHFILFALGADAPDSTGPGDCSQRDGGFLGGASFTAGATRNVQDAAMFGSAPEDQGMAGEVAPRQQYSANLHFVNVGDQDLVQELWVNNISFPADQVVKKVKAIEWLGGLAMSVPPGAHQTVTAGPSFSGGICSPGEADTRILGVTAHMHASTVRLSMYKQAPSDAQRQLVFEDYNWEEPTVFRYNSELKNPPPDAAAKTPGSMFSGVLLAQPGESYTWECEVVNNRSVSLTFSDKAYDGEMCNVFGMYSTPTAPAPWTCLSP